MGRGHAGERAVRRDRGSGGARMGDRRDGGRAGGVVDR